jgi:sugar lactone lactonase YvrE
MEAGMVGLEVRHVLDVKAKLGEAPLWSIEEEALFWVDIEHKTINRFDPVKGTNQAWQLPAIPGCFAFREGHGAVIATNRGYYDFDFRTGAIELICDAPFDSELFRFNDGKVDRQGRFWAGSIPFAFKLEGEGEGTFYRYEAGTVTPGIHGVKVPNGTAFSPDGRTMYRAESMDRAIYRLDYDPATGTASNQRVFATMPNDFGIPDGATVDTEGCLWSAVPFGATGKVARFTPDGELDLHFDVPVLVPTMVAFGGKDMSTLYITSASIEASLNRPSSPMSGDIFAVDTGFRGISETALLKA